MVRCKQRRNVTTKHCEKFMNSLARIDRTEISLPTNHVLIPTADEMEFAPEQGVLELQDTPVPTQTVSRFDPALLARLSRRAPGGYQVGE